jgi:hypothetical protein
MTLQLRPARLASIRKQGALDRESGTILLESRKKFLVLVAFLAQKADFFVANLLITTPRFSKKNASYSGMLLAQDIGPKAIETVNFNRGLYGRCRNPT